MRRQFTPLIMGAGMGLMMLWMAHGLMTGNSALAGPALAGFITAHVVVVAGVVAAGIYTSRLSPKIRALMTRLHRPTASHAASMLVAAALAAGAAHLIIHTGLT